MKIIDNINNTVKNDLQAGIHKGSKLSIAAACFSIYAYQELKKQLEGIDELRFIFTSPTFITEKTSKAQREFYIPRISRERSLYGTEFEVKLRNELTQKAIAKECADWIRRKVTFKSNVTQEQMMGFMTVDESTYMPINGFTTVDLGCERGNNAYYPVQKTESFENAQYFIKLFEQLWNDKKKFQEVTDVVIENITAAYRENAPEYIYFSPFTISFMSFWMIFPRTSFQTRQRALRKVKFGGCYITSSATPYLPSSASWKSLTAVSLRTASASAKRSQRLPSLSITKTATSPFLFSTRKNYPKTGIPIRAIISTTPLRRTGCAMMCCIIPTFRAVMDNRTALTLTA